MYGVATDKDRLHSRGGGLRGGHQNDRDNRFFCDRAPFPSRCFSGGDLRSVCLPPNTMI